MAIEKIKILGAVLELPAKQQYQSSPFTSNMGQIGSAVWLGTPKRLPGFWFFQLSWVPILPFSWNPLLPKRPKKLTLIWSFFIIFCQTTKSFNNENSTGQKITITYIVYWLRNSWKVQIVFSWKQVVNSSFVLPNDLRVVDQLRHEFSNKINNVPLQRRSTTEIGIFVFTENML